MALRAVLNDEKGDFRSSQSSGLLGPVTVQAEVAPEAR
jgi:hypothetical protein